MLLRRISKHVRDQNWLAVGIDFVIVVFGVFFAFQVTAWNDARTDRQKENDYLQRLHTDVSLSISRNEENVAFMRRHAEYGGLILETLDKCEITPAQQDGFASGVFLAGKITQPVLLRSTFDELKSTGRFEVIQNAELRNALNELVEAIEFQSGIDEKIFIRTTDAISEIQRKIIVTHGKPVDPAGDIDASGVRYNFTNLCADTTFKHAIAAARASTFSSVFFANSIIEQQQQVLTMLEHELEDDNH